MVEIELDGKKVQVAPGSMVMHAAEKAGIYIPHFCYHKKLSIAANCRMCLVEVEKAPKALPACATPVTEGMVVRTKSKKALDAQQSVMEFLLINHPLDCPICDQGGECQLQDLAVGYGAGSSRYGEEKRVVQPKSIGPLVSTKEMTRCIHCTRCVRFGEEIGGVMELGMVNRGEYAEITTVNGDTLDSELSGNVIDLCPVGALTSKPFRYAARTWELSRRKSISPHDSTGANLIVQVKNHKVMRVVPMENEAVNECWIADRDRFSYEALNSQERLTAPMVRQPDGSWKEVEWSVALEHVAANFKRIAQQNGANSIGALVSPHSTLEELHLASELVRGLGSDSIDYRLRHAQFNQPEGVRWLGMAITELQELESVLVVGSNLRKDHPLFAHRVRQAAKCGGKVFSLNSRGYGSSDWAMPVQASITAPAAQWARELAGIAAAIATHQGVSAPIELPELGGNGNISDEAAAVAKALLAGKKKAILLGNGAAHHAHASELLALAQWIAKHSGAVVGYLTEAANTVGAQWVQAYPKKDGLNAAQMLGGGLKAALLLHTEPQFDSAAATNEALKQTDVVVTLSAFKANMDISDVLLPVSPFSETSGTFVNAEGRVQSFHAVVRPLGQTRPAWKVLRVLANLLGLEGFEYQTSQEVLSAAIGNETAQAPTQVLSNATSLEPSLPKSAAGEPAVASIYQLDGLVRRATALQETADAKAAKEQQNQQGGLA